jgi:hypothetical protein
MCLLIVARKTEKKTPYLIFRRTTLSAFTTSSQDSTSHTGHKETEAGKTLELLLIIRNYAHLIVV